MHALNTHDAPLGPQPPLRPQFSRGHLPQNGAACRQQKGLQPSTQTPFVCPRGTFRAVFRHSVHPIPALPARIPHSYSI